MPDSSPVAAWAQRFVAELPAIGLALHRLAVVFVALPPDALDADVRQLQRRLRRYLLRNARQRARRSTQRQRSHANG